MGDCLESSAKAKTQKETEVFVLLFMNVEKTVGLDDVGFDLTRKENLKMEENFRRRKRKKMELWELRRRESRGGKARASHSASSHQLYPHQ